MKCFVGRTGDESEASSSNRLRVLRLLGDRSRDEPEDPEERERVRRLDLLRRARRDTLLRAGEREHEESEERDDERTLLGDRLTLLLSSRGGER